MTFEDLDILPPLLRAVGEAGYTQPTPIQEQAIPPVLRGRDLLGCAQTGTGKTAAFALPILQLLSGGRMGRGRSPRALILTPTRELALQIEESFETYGKYLPLRCCVLYGGVSQNPQVEALRQGVDVLVATPGRLCDLIGQGYVSLKAVEIFVLDEADRMLDMGFIHDVKRVVALLPPKRQTLFFSATMPPEVAGLVNSLLKNPVRVAINQVSSAAEGVKQAVYFVDKANKRKLLAYLLREQEIPSALVFTRTKHGADRVARDLNRAGVNAKAIHGDKSQNARQAALSGFKNGSVRVLVATDIAARGIDIVQLPYVINYDLPNVPETYVHRIGRTGRAGLTGQAISFCDCTEKPYLAQIEKLTHIPVAVREGHPYPMEVLVPPESPARPGESGASRAPQARGRQQPGRAAAGGAKRPVPAGAQRPPRGRGAFTRKG